MNRHTSSFLLVIMLSAMATLTSAQSIPDGGFEQGTGSKFTLWNTTFTGARVSSHTQQSVTTTPYEGSYFLRLITKDTMIGSTSVIVIPTASITFAHTTFPDSLVFNYIYYPKIAEDGFSIDVDFLKYDPSTHQSNLASGNSFSGIGSGSVWQRFSTYFSYFGFPPEHDSIRVTLRSTQPGQHDQGTGAPLYGNGATLLADGIQFIYNTPTGVAEKSAQQRPAITIYPNPASSVIHVSGSAYESYSITDLAGKVITHGNAAEQIDISGLEEGSYLMTINDGSASRVLKFMKVN